MSQTIAIVHKESGMMKNGLYGFSRTYLFLVGLSHYFEAN
jgi:hypothetical protein